LPPSNAPAAAPAPAAAKSKGPSLTHLAIVVGVLAAGVVITALTSDVDEVSEPGIRVFETEITTDDGQVMTVERPFLPDTAGDWQGGPLEGLSQAERDILPKDTQGARRIYTRPDGKQVYCSIVLAGRDVTSIHRPEMCLPGQGWAIRSEFVEDVPVTAAANGHLGVMRMNASRKVQLENGQTANADSIFAYWFVGKGRVTPHHWQRIMWTTRDRVLHNTNHRWAYILVHVPVNNANAPLNSTKPAEEAMALVSNFVQDVYPSLMVN
jgi:EpsI family protein